MASLFTALIALMCMCAGVLLGSFLRSRVPDHHLRDDSKDVVKAASGMIATLVALVNAQVSAGLFMALALFYVFESSLFGRRAT